MFFIYYSRTVSYRNTNGLINFAISTVYPLVCT